MPNAKGVLDYPPEKWCQMSRLIETVRRAALTLDVVEIDTPVIETTELLLEKYGEEAEAKQIFRLEKGKTSLRYDLTVPLTRYLQDNGLENLRRFQVGKVFRKDKPEIERARFREFYQADVDLVGDYPPLMCEIELFYLINRVLRELSIGEYLIRYNYRDNLYAICHRIDVKAQKAQKAICATIDKLDKVDWKEVAEELKAVRNLSDEQIDSLRILLRENYLDPKLAELDRQLTRLSENLTFDATLARGLDYYTGIIFEVTVPSSPVKTVIAGGRYDRLVYKTTNGGRRYVPAIGVSFGLSRLQLLMKEVEPEYQRVMVISRDLEVKACLLRYYRNQGMVATYDRTGVKTIRQITHAVKNNFRLAVIYGEDGDLVRVKELYNSDPDQLYPVSRFA
jgi:histidyl-tRNA synthetase